jgi:hypothetical protein
MTEDLRACFYEPKEQEMDSVPGRARFTRPIKPGKK